MYECRYPKHGPGSGCRRVGQASEEKEMKEKRERK